MSNSLGSSDTILRVRRHISAPPEQLFAYWTEPAHLAEWWGPANVHCDSASLDLRVGGEYRIANRFPDGTVLWITGVFEVVAPPRQLVYTWLLGAGNEAGDGRAERVTVSFTPANDGTEVEVVHERIANRAARAEHERGWIECLAGLAAYAARENERSRSRR
jgi:uncharacterized protein YndB with AHSA1/START domain